jgi:hypothetical protein
MYTSNKNYLSAKNILLIFSACLACIVIAPGANSWLVVSDDYTNQWYVNFIGESLFVALAFSFKYLIDKKFKTALYLSALAICNLALCVFLIHTKIVHPSIIPFFHPITLSLTCIFAFEKKYSYAVAGYIIGYFFSFMPLAVSLFPILVYQLLMSSLSAPLKESKKISRFLSRLSIYSTVGFGIHAVYISLTNNSLLFPGVSFSKLHEIIMSTLSVIATYTVLAIYLKKYYKEFGNKMLNILSYIPPLWIVPLFSILINQQKKLNLQ